MKRPTLLLLFLAFLIFLASAWGLSPVATSDYGPAVKRLASHTNGLLSRKCRATVRVTFTNFAALTRWRARHVAAHAAKSACPVVPAWITNAFLCIHRYEGSWTANTGNGYFGGLQMDWNFMLTYGPSWSRRDGRLVITANRWSPSTQIFAGYRAWKTRGFYPWPNTARMCGLL